MGVRGLTALVERNDDLLRKHRLRDTHLVIDGSNLVHYLHYLSSVLKARKDHVFGGDYLSFNAIVRKFFSALLKCDIKPIVVLDGGIDKSDLKIGTKLKRLSNRLTECRIVSKTGASSCFILPILCTDVFVNILIEMNIMLVRSTFEADNDIMMIANSFGCPVLSNDSDFFIFDLNGGFIPLRTFNFAAVCDRSSSNGKQLFIDCRFYHIDNLLSFFSGLDKSLLPLFSCLMGNDYISEARFRHVFNALPNVINKHLAKRLQIPNKHKKMIHLLDYMRNKTRSEVIEGLLRFLKSQEREKAKNLLTFTLESYGCACNPLLIDYLKTQNKDVLNEPLQDENIPSWFMQRFNAGVISANAIDILVKKKLLLKPQIEDFVEPSSYACSAKLQQCFFQLLKRDENDDSEILIYERKNSNICKTACKIAFNGVCLNFIPSMTNKQKLAFVLNEIDADKASFDSLSQKLHDYVESDTIANELTCLVYIIKFWLENTAMSSIWLEFVVSLCATVCYCLFTTITENTKQDVNVKSVNENFKKFDTAFVPNNAKPFQTHIVHYYCEVQAIVAFFQRINSLLDFPLPKVRAEIFFNGILLYNLTTELCNRPVPLLYVTQQFGEQFRFANLIKFLYEFLTMNKIIERRFKNKEFRKKKKKDKTNERFSQLEIDCT
ncbi:hypothetical protein B4U79_17462 [Dinothrombium tinctorium]|uniref:XPG N-terminal domain-containing protein n=1 Tax=Dinothrombium tinctorium TaxID=1965070 RepID=A0A3S3PNS8_9ACAR|nr:hypothetical protein B4U79_16337 [Dinothrombium tinctorium]RWS07958.1 hypothetical protein B4U79_17821 [Dinothrombium tinctorium]RWS08044.1 hypothetical protein B4U79_17814 [Dinothrombium tinctorium]RWS12413.1 hypothetical protein B4U79_17462 [Dinothrombium tinctorium]